MKKSLIILLLSLFFGFIQSAYSQRVAYSFNDSWRFSKSDFPSCINADFDDSKWESVNIPHTWNKTDVILKQPTGGFIG